MRTKSEFEVLESRSLGVLECLGVSWSVLGVATERSCPRKGKELRDGKTGDKPSAERCQSTPKLGLLPYLSFRRRPRSRRPRRPRPRVLRSLRRLDLPPHLR